MILGICSIFMNFCCCCGFVVAIPAIIIGHTALYDIRRNGCSGRKMALVGLWTGYLSILLPIIFILGYFIISLLLPISALFS